MKIFKLLIILLTFPITYPILIITYSLCGLAPIIGISIILIKLLFGKVNNIKDYLYISFYFIIGPFREYQKYYNST